MKTTIELPDDLFVQVKLRSVREGRKFKDAVADSLRKWLDDREDTAVPAEPVLITNPIDGLPMVVCTRKPSPDEELTPERIKDILLDQDIKHYFEAIGQ